jgi:hypothetical protein
MQVQQIQGATTARPRSWTRTALKWLVTFVGFPLGGLLAELVVGPVDGIGVALLGGAISGLVLGSVQAWALHRNGVIPELWAGATAAGFAVGLAVGASTVGYGTSMSDLALQGAITGLAVGIAQGAVLAAKAGKVAFVWPPLLAGVWALGWTITSAIGVDVEKQYTVFGSSGAITVTILTVVLPLYLTARGFTQREVTGHTKEAS